jgi:ABC-2 type transport system ATP-binding protein
MEAAAVVCRGLSKRYGDVAALVDLDLEVPAGTVFGFLGPNGAGKTTTLRLLTGLAAPTAGTATVAGIEVRPGATGRVPCGYLDQDPRFYGWMRGRELLALVADLHGLRGAERAARIDEALQLVDLADAAGRRIGGYSGGMRQRLGLAAALLPRPAVLFLDEPVSALDPAGRHDLLGLIAGLRGRTTVFMSTHILNDVERVCDRVAILDHGRLIADAAVDALLARHAAPVYRIEAEPGADVPLAALAAALAQEHAVTSVTRDGLAVRVEVADPVVGGPVLYAAIARSGLAPIAVERQRPTLEDVFLSIVAGDSPA